MSTFTSLRWCLIFAAWPLLATSPNIISITTIYNNDVYLNAACPANCITDGTVAFIQGYTTRAYMQGWAVGLQGQNPHCITCAPVSRGELPSSGRMGAMSFTRDGKFLVFSFENSNSPEPSPWNDPGWGLNYNLYGCRVYADGSGSMQLDHCSKWTNYVNGQGKGILMVECSRVSDVCAWSNIETQPTGVLNGLTGVGFEYSMSRLAWTGYTESTTTIAPSNTGNCTEGGLTFNCANPHGTGNLSYTSNPWWYELGGFDGTWIYYMLCEQNSLFWFHDLRYNIVTGVEQEVTATDGSWEEHMTPIPPFYQEVLVSSSDCYPGPTSYPPKTCWRMGAVAPTGRLVNDTFLSNFNSDDSPEFVGYDKLPAGSSRSEWFPDGSGFVSYIRRSNAAPLAYPLVYVQVRQPAMVLTDHRYTGVHNIGRTAATDPNAPVLPQRTLDAYAAAPGSLPVVTVNVNPGDNLQTKLNAVADGTNTTLILDGTFTGNFTTPSLSTGWLTIKSKNYTVQPAGTRVGPSDATNMAKIVTANSNPALAIPLSSSNIRLLGIEMYVDPSVGLNYGLFTVNGEQTTTAGISQNVTVVQSYIHGADLCHCKRGVLLNGGSAAIADSYISEFHGLGQDAQAIMAYNGTGPYTFTNDYIEAAAENLLFGGAGPQTNGLIPSDITITGNAFDKPTAWMNSVIPAPSGVSVSNPGGAQTLYFKVQAYGPLAADSSDPGDASGEVSASANTGATVTVSWSPVTYGTELRAATSYAVYVTTDAPGGSRNWHKYTTASTSYGYLVPSSDGTAIVSAPSGYRWVCKNDLEFKNAQRVYVANNTLQHSWVNGQAGFLLLVTPRDVDSTDLTTLFPWVVASDITVENNTFSHAAEGVTISGTDSYCTPVMACATSARVAFRNNTFTDINPANWLGGGNTRNLFQVNGNYVRLENNTETDPNHGGNFMAIGWMGGSLGNVPMSGLRVVGNTSHGELSGAGTGYGTTSLATYAPGYTFTGNTLYGATGTYPTGNTLLP